MQRGWPVKHAMVAALLIQAACSLPAAVATPTPSPTPSLAPSMTPMALSIFDAHLHYSREAWDSYPPGKMAELMNANGIRGALVSSAPDEGSFRLKAVLGDRIVPTLGPYRTRADPTSWTRDPSVVGYLQSVYRRGAHRGFGEFHLKAGETTLPTVKSALEFAARERLFLHMDGDARALAELLDFAPDATVLWAHAGTDATAEQVDALLVKWPKLWVELSFRDFDMSFRGELDARWGPVLLKHRDRLMVGTDTWVLGRVGLNDRLDGFAELIKSIRAWLRLLPPEVGEAIAHGNAERFLAQLPR
jgi:hypothetical protein